MNRRARWAALALTIIGAAACGLLFAFTQGAP